jgi:hypothetical protein
VLLVDETGVPGENHRTDVSHWQTLSHKVVSSIPHNDRDGFLLSKLSINNVVNMKMSLTDVKAA